MTFRLDTSLRVKDQWQNNMLWRARNKLIPDKATEQELLGEAVFNGKGQCISCHSGPASVDDYMHDLNVERFYEGRPEGSIKTFPLRGIKDSAPYFHDRR